LQKRTEQEINKVFNNFVCEKDDDIEYFLKNKAIIFEKLGKCRTFIIYDEENNKFEILGYFTLALQILKIPNRLSNRKIKILDGFSAKKDNEVITELPCILIGQFGKNYNCHTKITGAEIMSFCLNILFDGQEKLGGRLIALECKNVGYLIDFYKNFNFDLINQNTTNELLQFIRVLNEDELI
jgi:hypothetical protein